MIFKQAPEARFEKRGRKYHLVIGSSPFTAFHSKKGLTQAKLSEVSAVQKDTPVFVRSEPSKSAALWLYGGRFWWADPGLDQTEIKALAQEVFTRGNRRIARAKERMRGGDEPKSDATMNDHPPRQDMEARGK